MVEYSHHIWLSLTNVLGKISEQLMKHNMFKKSELEYYIVMLIYNILFISRTFNIDVIDSWENWKLKAISKEYT